MNDNQYSPEPEGDRRRMVDVSDKPAELRLKVNNIINGLMALLLCALSFIGVNALTKLETISNNVSDLKGINKVQDAHIEFGKKELDVLRYDLRQHIKSSEAHK